MQLNWTNETEEKQKKTNYKKLQNLKQETKRWQAIVYMLILTISKLIILQFQS